MRPVILHIDNSPAVTGAYKALLSWCLAAPEFEHIWVLPEGSAVAEEARTHFRVYTLPFVEIGRSAGRLLGYLPALLANGRRLAGIIEKHKVAAVHANDLYNLTPYAARLFCRRKLPLLVHLRMLRRSFPGRIYDFWLCLHLKRAGAVVAVSEAIRRDCGGDPGIRVIYDPIELSESLPAFRFRKSADEPFRFLYLANYIQGKGQEDALQAVRILREQGETGFRVDFYGGTMGLPKNEAFKASLQAAIDAAGLGEVAQLHGPSDHVEALMKQHHGLLHFSHAESFGMVCYEALYYGLPVISSDCGGPAEMMDPGVSGLLRPVGDVQGFATDMKRLLNDPQFCAAMSEQASSYVRNRFQDGGARLVALFQQLM